MNRFVFRVPEAHDELVSVAADSLAQAVERLRATLAARGIESRCCPLQWAEADSALPASEVRSYEPACVVAYRQARYAVLAARKLAPIGDLAALDDALEALEDLLADWRRVPSDDDNAAEVAHEG